MFHDGKLFVDHNIHCVFISFTFIQILETHFPRYFPVERRVSRALVSLIALRVRSTDLFSQFQETYVAIGYLISSPDTEVDTLLCDASFVCVRGNL